VEIENIVRHLGDLDEWNDTVSLSYTFTLSSLIGNIDTERFYTYRGKLKLYFFELKSQFVILLLS
jgi:hypothetical protein